MDTAHLKVVWTPCPLIDDLLNVICTYIPRYVFKEDVLVCDRNIYVCNICPFHKHDVTRFAVYLPLIKPCSGSYAFFFITTVRVSHMSMSISCAETYVTGTNINTSFDHLVRISLPLCKSGDTLYFMVDLVQGNIYVSINRLPLVKIFQRIRTDLLWTLQYRYSNQVPPPVFIDELTYFGNII